jgi:hypothetical protein
VDPAEAPVDCQSMHIQTRSSNAPDSVPVREVYPGLQGSPPDLGSYLPEGKYWIVLGESLGPRTVCLWMVIPWYGLMQVELFGAGGPLEILV